MGDTDSSATTIEIELPVEDGSLFASDSISDVLFILSQQPYRSFTARELADIIGASTMTVRRAVDTLATNDLVNVHRDGRAKPVQINRARLSKPDDSVLQIPQPEYHEPVYAALEGLRDSLDDVLAVVLYGSVARGDADRRSDIDLWVLVGDERAANQRAANAVKQDLEDREFAHGRFYFDIDVEVVDGISTYSDPIEHIVLTGIPLYKTSEFESLEIVSSAHEDE